MQNDAMHHACWDKLSGGFAGTRFVEHAREAHCLDLCRQGIWFANGENAIVVEYRKVKSETQTQMTGINNILICDSENITFDGEFSVG